MKKLLLNTAMTAARYGQTANAHAVRKICHTDENGNPLQTSVSRGTWDNNGKLKSIAFDMVSSPSIPAGTLLNGFIKNKIATKQKLLLKRKVLPKDKILIGIKRKLLIKLLRSA